MGLWKRFLQKKIGMGGDFLQRQVQDSCAYSLQRTARSYNLSKAEQGIL